MKNIIEVAQSVPHCVNCGKSDWRINKENKKVCVYCGHPMKQYLTKQAFKDTLKSKIKETKNEN